MAAESSPAAQASHIGMGSDEVMLPTELPIVHLKPSKEDATTPLPRVLFVYTGGTLGMKPQQDGALAPAPGYLTERMKNMDELFTSKAPASDLLELTPLIDSSDMGPAHWVAIANIIAKHYLDYDGFVVMMGTDTMGYAASALSYLLENLGKTVCLTGAMVPLAEPYNDARRNVIVSGLVAAYLDVPEVVVFMNRSVFRGNRTMKVHNGGLKAYDSPNYPALASLTTKLVPYPSRWRPQASARLRVQQTWESNIAVVKLVPGYCDDMLIKGLVSTPGLKGIVLEVLGTGNVGRQKAPLIAALKAAVHAGIVVVGTTQCSKGSVSWDTYAAGAVLGAAGVLSAQDMTTEAAVTKLGWLLGRPGLSTPEVRALFLKDLRGELTALQGEDEARYTFSKL